jgi:hypothetical protein
MNPSKVPKKKKKIGPGYRKFSAYEPVALQEFTHNLFGGEGKKKDSFQTHYYK